ncbi:MAG: PQQ-binding-like beta-propeller repeat protein [Flavobacteriales bacterium]
MRSTFTVRRAFLVTALFIEALAFGQGFNARYDAFDWGFPQSAVGIELTSAGYAVISTSSDCDSISPTECFFHASVLFTFLNGDGTRVDERRSWRDNHSSIAGWANCCDTIPGGGYIVGGASEAIDGSDEVYLMRFDANGDTLWTRVFGDPTLYRFWIGQQVKCAPNGDFLVVGFTDQNGPFNAFVLRTDDQGNELWRRIYAYSPSSEGGIGSIALADGGDLFTGGTRSNTPGNADRWVQRLRFNGDVRWQVSWGGDWSEGSTQVATLADGNIFVCSGKGYAAQFSENRPYLAKLDSTDGSIIWEKEYGPAATSTLFFAGKETPNGDLIACGVTYAEQGQKGLLLRTNSQGDSLWMRSYYYQDEVISNGQGRFYDVLPTPDGGFIAAGAVYNPVQAPNPPGYSQDTWVVKVDADGCIVPGCNGVGITEQATNLLGALTIFPNPAAQGGSVTVQLDLPPSVDSSPLQYTVVSADGRVVLQEQLPSGISPSPSEKVGVRAFSLSHLSSGLYHVHISSGNTWLTGGKLIVE